MVCLRACRKWSLPVLAIGVLAIAFVFAGVQPVEAQSTIATGSIQGTVTDQTGAVVPGAKVTITNKDTGQVVNLISNTSGVYNSGALIPGNYVVRVEAKNFKTSELPVAVQLGVTSSGSVTLQVGTAQTVVQVAESAVQVNTEQPTVQGVVTLEQIESLPTGGRNFLDLAQLEPGVQIQDGNQFDPTKVGYSSISFGGRFGRTARIEVDGVDVSDETVGTTTENIPLGSIQEFNLEQSTLDPSTELTSSGAVAVTTRSGTNKFHGEGYEFFRSNKLAAEFPGPVGFSIPFQRSQFGGNFGGPILQDKLFFFMDGERTWQALADPVPVSAPFQSFSGTFQSPYREGDVLGRVDYNGPHGMRMFYRFSYFKNKAFSTFGAISFQPFKNVDQTRQHVVGTDFTTGQWTHSLRFSYLKFQNNIFDAVLGSTLPFANFPVSMNVLGLSTGPNFLAPQTTPQSNHQFKYDGSRVWGNHIIRYGFDWNHIQGGGFAKFFGLDPSVFTFSIRKGYTFPAGCPAVDPSTGFSPDPTCNPIGAALIGNGQGFSTEHRAFGFPFGGLGPDNRIGLYLGDSWKVRRNLTLDAGLRWDRDTGRTDSDLPPIAAINQFLPGLGGSVQQANTNLAPQVGLAWDVTGSGKTVVRMGAGLFYENVIYNNVLFDRPPRLARGAFLSFPAICAGGTAFPIVFGPQGPFAGQSITIDTGLGNAGPSICGESIGNAAASLASFETLYQNSFCSAPAAPAQCSSPVAGPNPGFIGTSLSNGLNVGSALFAPGYKSPRGFQFNVGVQRQIKPGIVLSVDYIRNVNTHYLLGIDANHAGDISTFNRTNALSAISLTNNSLGCGTGTDAASINCAIAAGATMASYAVNGLDSPGDVGGACQSGSVLATPMPCAFPGINSKIGQLYFLFPVGRSTYDALQVKFIGDKQNVLPGIRHLNYQVSYAYSSFKNDGSVDQDFVNTALDNNNPLRYFGPSALDRRHQLSMGAYVDVPFGFQVSFLSHFYSPLARTLQVPFTGTGAGEIFRTDFTGSGVSGNTFSSAFPPFSVPLPGTTSGEFGRGISSGNINNVISGYNSNALNAGCPANMVGGGCPTPAGQVLISNGLFTLAQLQALGGVSPSIPLAPAGEVGLAPVKVFDLKVGWKYTIMEKVTVNPSVSIYNLFNFANFDLGPYPASLNGDLTGSDCSINGTISSGCTSRRAAFGTGVNTAGAPREVEFGLKITF